MTNLNAQPVDLETLRAKYRMERDKRLRTDGIKQFIEADGEFSYFTDDPYVAWIERAPIVRRCEVAIVGAGFGGILGSGPIKFLHWRRCLDSLAALRRCCGCLSFGC
jgi:hypothetical protein